ncbi:SGNH/GDSL hydrolase family protein [Streptomyces sp. TLI_171]|uniref:SGNH/GDSL hydrolase family protein n=1 Tax=Streptomyces sp. TLI_171 TaxID=1938859 RepID=UPI000C18045D|nr:SGNH/GDSL hydrolase family protein [Streptomyces sp. TLI_171]RKE18496.1 lysophospholipase L1-like esterase [Streptomyces sp. TLI_171]
MTDLLPPGTRTSAWRRRSRVAAGSLACALALALLVGNSLPSAASSAQALPPLDLSQHLRIMPLGDSITAGVGSSTGDAYRWDLARYLVDVQQIYTATYVGSQRSGQEPNPINEGHSGWRIDELTSQIDGWMAAARPDVVLLHAGVNDARQGASAQTMADRMSALLGRILAAAPTVRVVVGDVIPPWYGTTNDIASAAVQRFDAMLPAVVAAAGPRVSLARLSAAVPSGALGDGLHPNDTGYRYMAWVWWRCMAPLLSADGITRAGVDPLPTPVPQSALCSG